MTPGPMGFRGAHHGAMGFKVAIEMTLRNQYVEDRKSFFFCWRSHQNPEKTVAFCVEDLFFEITSKSRDNCGIFSFCFGVHKTGDV